MKSLLKKYLKNTSGNIAMMFGLGTFILFVGTGIAIDLSGMSNTDKHVQDMADMAVLAAAASGEQAPGQLKQIAQDVIDENNTSGSTLDVDLTITAENAIHVEVTTEYDMKIMRMFGYGSQGIRAIAEAPPKGDVKMNLALVLDVTGSMGGSKLAALQTAAKDMVTEFEGGPSGDVMMSVVPFARYIKIPTSYAGASWLELETDGEHCWDRLDYDASSGCEEDDDENGGWDCDDSVYYEVCEDLSWNGCVGSRTDPYHKQALYDGTNKIQGFVGGGSCRSELLPMTTNLTSVKTAIDGLTAEDYTYIPAGLMWGWRTLLPGAPLTEVNTADYNLKKNALILMSDGENTRSYGGTEEGFNGVFHWEDDQEAADTLTAELCESIKADDIEIYAIAFEVSDSSTISMLTACASDSSKFYSAGDAIALEKAFADIGEDLAQVRLSR